MLRIGDLERAGARAGACRNRPDRSALGGMAEDRGDSDGSAGSAGTRSRAISEVLDDLETAGDDERVTVGCIVEAMGERSFAPLLLVPALLMVSPISTIPGTPTISGIIIALIAAQMLAGRETLWLPRFLRDRGVSTGRMARAVGFLRKPVSRVEAVIKPRLTWLTRAPSRHVVLLTCLAITLVMPLMEFVPALASIAALAISLFAVGLLTRDGLFVCGGFAVVLAGALVARNFL